jgi:preprotein translocase subunit SecG
MIGYYIISFLYVIVCLVLLLVILLQQGKGDMGSAFGGGGSGTAAFGARTGATLLTKATTVCAVLFMVGALVLAIIGQRGPRSLVSGTPAPPATTQQKTNPAAPTAPPQQATPPGSPAPVPASPAPQTPAPNPGK